MSRPIAAERFHAPCRTEPLGLGERCLALRGEQPRVSASDALPLPETQTPLSPRRRGSLPRDTDRPSPRLDGPFGALFHTKPPKPPEPPKPVYYRPPKTASLPQKRDLAKTIYLQKRANSGISQTLTFQNTSFGVGFSWFRRFRRFRGFSAKKGPERTRESHRATRRVSVSDGHSLSERKRLASPSKCRSLTEKVSVAHLTGVGRSPRLTIPFGGGRVSARRQQVWATWLCGEFSGTACI